MPFEFTFPLLTGVFIGMMVLGFLVGLSEFLQWWYERRDRERKRQEREGERRQIIAEIRRLAQKADLP